MKIVRIYTYICLCVCFVVVYIYIPQHHTAVYSDSVQS